MCSLALSPSPLSLAQMFPLATVVGNTFVIKPSEQDPGACMMLAQLAQDAGMPDGVLNVIHGQKEGRKEGGRGVQGERGGEGRVGRGVQGERGEGEGGEGCAGGGGEGERGGRGGMYRGRGEEGRGVEGTTCCLFRLLSPEPRGVCCARCPFTRFPPCSCGLRL